ncbi:MAG: 30S ribosomal protein S16 [Alphaproteobacteria bacterium]|nr:30S ribosomal protein S16 [Alphaproteobacteria bacterium]
MALKIRLARAGAKKRPYYRIVIAENTSPRDGRFVEKVGTYNPMLPHEHKDRIHLVEDRIKHWLSVGAQPTDRVARFLGQANIIAMPTINESPKKSLPKQKAQERTKEKEEKLEAAKTAVAETAAPPASAAEGSEPQVEEVTAETEGVEAELAQVKEVAADVEVATAETSSET